MKKRVIRTISVFLVLMGIGSTENSFTQNFIRNSERQTTEMKLA